MHVLIYIIKQESFIQISFIVLSILLILFIQSTIRRLSYFGNDSPGINSDPAHGVYPSGYHPISSQSLNILARIELICFQFFVQNT